MQHPDLHEDATKLAESLIDGAIEYYDDEICFNLFRFLSTLEAELADLLEEYQESLNGFILDSEDLARYVWCCITIKEGYSAYPNIFRGMPVLD